MFSQVYQLLPYALIIHAFRSIVWSHTVIIQSLTLASLSYMLTIQPYTSNIMYSHTPIFCSVIANIHSLI